MAKKVIVVGSGGREHALAWKLSQSDKVDEVYIAPGNGGTDSVGKNVDIKFSEPEKLIEFCKEKSIDLVVIGPDDALAAGLANTLRENGFATFGPSKKAAQIESSKAFAKDLMKNCNVPTGKYATFTDVNQALAYVKDQTYPLVIKASGLALGKGVIICQSLSEAEAAIQQMMVDKAFNEAGDTIVVEEFLTGSEVSFHALSDGKNYVIFPPSQDHKQILDGDKGPNTGGMGAFGPVNWVSAELKEQVEKTMVQPTIKGLNDIGSTFNGCLYPGLMITKNGPKVLEFNARFGDPETQIYMRLLNSDLFDLLYSCATGSLNPEDIRWRKGFAVTVVLASGGYPGNYQKGVEISGLEEAESMEDIVLFHAGTKSEAGKIVTSGGRVLNVTAFSETLDEAINKAYSAIDKINFEGMQYRKDIGRREKPAFI